MRGSFTFSSGVRCSWARKSQTHTPPSPIAAAASTHENPNPREWKVGSIQYTRSTIRITIIKAATRASSSPRRFTYRLSSTRNGTKKWNTIRIAATRVQPACDRSTYHGVSSGILPDQIIRYCEKEVYAHKQVKASIRLPRSWNREASITPENGFRSDSRKSTMIQNASVSSTWPTAKIAPYMVEYQCGSKDMIQSTEASVTVKVNRIMPGPLTARDPSG